MDIPKHVLEQKFQRHLNHSRTDIRLDLAERARLDVFNVADRQAEIGMVQQIKQFTAELKLFRFRQPDVLEGGEVPVDISGAQDGVAAFVSEDLESAQRIGLELLKSFYVEPFLRGARTGVWVSNYIGTIGGEAGDLRRLPLQGGIGGVVYREWRAAHRREDPIQLPVT